MKKILLFALAGVLALGTATSCKKETFLVTFNSQGGTAVAPRTVKDGSKVARPTDPTREGYDFVDWTRSATGGTVWNFNNSVNSDITLYAQWESQGGDVDLTELNDLITEAKALNQDDYTEDSWAKFAGALVQAEAVAASSSATAAEVEEAIDDLQTAMDNLVEKTATGGDKGDLNDVIDQADGLDEGDYTSDSWGDLQDALDHAREVADDPDATQEEIDEANDALEDAINNLVPSATSEDKAKLEEAIDAAKDLNEGNYTPDSWANLETTLEAAEAVDADADATKEEVDEAYTNLENAIDGLVFDPNAGGNNGTTGGDNGGGTPTAADKSALETVIANAESLTESDYTTDSWAAMETALTQAKSIDANTNASQAQVNAAASNLRLKVAALVHTSSSDPGSTDPGNADKSALKSAIDNANALVEANYTADSWAVMKNDLANAQNVYNNADATQQQVNTALATLQTGVNNLERSTANDGLVSSLLNQLISLVNSLPSASAIQNNPLLAATVIPVATLADTVRDQLVSLLGTSNDPQIADLSSTLNGVLSALGLGNLI